VRPDVPSAEDCPPRPRQHDFEDTIRSRLDERLAAGRSFDELDGEQGTGNSAIWVRLPEVLEMSAAALAIIGDFVPSGIGQALGRRAGGNSLDNTLRVAHRVPTDWVLADIRVHAVADGFGHGLVHLWAEDGTLLGTASQSTIVRSWREQPAQTAAEERVEG
jgi:acyl-CoA thioesterase-2